jgi:flagellar motor switch protein FliM
LLKPRTVRPTLPSMSTFPADAPSLDQSDVDRLSAGLDGTEQSSNQTVGLFDFRRPDKFSRDHVRSLRTAHEVLARDLGRSLSQRLRCLVTLEALAVDQITYEDYVRSLPDPSVLAILGMDPLPGPAVMEMSVQIGRSLVDRLLGGSGAPALMRRPTSVEAALLHELMEQAIQPLTDAMSPFEAVTPELQRLEFSPQFAQVIAPTDMVLVLTYQMSLVTDMRVDGSFSLCYPYPTLEPAMGSMEQKLWGEPGSSNSPEDESRPFGDLLPDLDTPLSVRLKPSPVPACELAALQPGNVVRLNHKVHEPAIVEVGDAAVLRGHLGQQGRRFVVQIVDWQS